MRVAAAGRAERLIKYLPLFNGLAVKTPISRLTSYSTSSCFGLNVHHLAGVGTGRVAREFAIVFRLFRRVSRMQNYVHLRTAVSTNPSRGCTQALMRAEK